MSTTPTLWEFEWRWLPGPVAITDHDLITQCVELYSTEYGSWGPRGPRPGEQVRITEDQLRTLLESDDAWLASAGFQDSVAAYCAALRFDLPGLGNVAWVTQLVVGSTYRRLRLATTLLFSMWQFSDCHAWGLLTANPFAVRALETATRRPCRRRTIVEHADPILEALASRLSFAPPSLITDAKGSKVPRLDTQFFLDHSEVSSMKEKAGRQERPWNLGDLDEGEEWFACTLAAQPPSALDRDRLELLLEGADRIWVRAFEGMTLDEEHHWHSHTSTEADFIAAYLPQDRSARVLDVGCGDGRHSHELASRGCQVVGVEISPRLLSAARDRAGNNVVEFIEEDARARLPHGPFDTVLCLYDVLGSSANRSDDLAMLKNIRRVLACDGHAIISVMNKGAVAPYLEDSHKPGSLPDFLNALEALPPSSTMEGSGEIFNLDLMLMYEGVFYRKEQFQRSSTQLPTEMVMRDLRYSDDELSKLLEEAQLRVEVLVPVQAGQWARTPPLPAEDQRAKELLVIAAPL